MYMPRKHWCIEAKQFTTIMKACYASIVTNWNYYTTYTTITHSLENQGTKL